MARYADDVHLRLARLHRALISGAYAPGPLRRVDIPKKGGGIRTLAIPNVEDRVAQAAVALVLGPRLDGELEDDSFGYRPGRSVRMAVDRVSANYRDGYRWVVDGDIESFFDSVPHDRLMERLARSLDSRRLLDLIADWLRAYGGSGAGLPQGSPLSPLLANVFLDDVDERIATKGVRLVRFADDFVLMCKREKTAEAALERMATLLEAQGLRLNRAKSRVVGFEEGFRFLGHLFVRSVRLEAPEPPADAVEHASPADPPTPAADDGREAEAAARATLTPVRGETTSLAPRLRLLYVTTPGFRLDVRDECFVVREDTRDLLVLHHRQVDRIEMGPRTAIGDEAVRLALAEAIPVAMVDGWGELEGEISPPMPQRGALHLDQAQVVLDPERRSALASTLVAGRLHNQRALLYRLAARADDGEAREAVKAAAERIGRLRRKARPRCTVPELMGVEGEATALYWPALGKCLRHGWRLRFRRRRPPPDPVNLVLSWTSALLYRDTMALLARHGLHPGFGVLHTSRDGAPALASDLIEALRAPIAEALTVTLFNNRVLDRDDFEKNADGSNRMDAEASRRMIREYERWLSQPVRLVPGGDEVLWRGVIEEQVLAYKRHIIDGEPFTPYAIGAKRGWPKPVT